MPQTDVPGEWTSPTQPFPTKPPPYDRQGVSIDDLIDFTPALRAEAVEGVKAFRIGPIFTPPSLAKAPDGTGGTLMLPHATGGANWEGGAFDPETNVLYVGSFTNPFILALEPPPEGSDITYINGGGAQLPWLQGLPLIKPPWGRITAIDMNQRRAPVADRERADAQGDRRAPGAPGPRHSADGNGDAARHARDENAAVHGRRLGREPRAAARVTRRPVPSWRRSRCPAPSAAGR